LNDQQKENFVNKWVDAFVVSICFLTWWWKIVLTSTCNFFFFWVLNIIPWLTKIYLRCFWLQISQ
jgi:hypothetical protein